MNISMIYIYTHKYEIYVYIYTSICNTSMVYILYTHDTLQLDGPAPFSSGPLRSGSG